ncbi:MAG: type II toxin-antitoxin system VapC family toxin [Candidatus Eremiobacteraeota bacterium]|nr:type II toxin-antitoxin system VapC family toxin [Candidatus Eremiobacteraeota bacterium]MCW5870998.1 type II toxin-antitoxin system VapC family toxin [Candidatus Eremiobacteraeota bacterium]
MVVSALMKGEETAVTRLSLCRRDQVFLPQPVLAEIAFGLSKMPESKRKRSLEQRFLAILKNVGRVEWTDSVSEQFGQIKAGLEARGTLLEDFDVAISAHALAHGHILVSENLRHLARIPDLQLESWAESNS